MTLQIGMVGTEGMVLASDRCMVELSNARNTSLSSKIVHLPESKVFYCFSGDDCSWLTGQDLEEKLRNGFNFEQIAQELQSIGNARWQAEKDSFESRRTRWNMQADRRITVAFYGRTPAELWQLKILQQSQCFPIYDKKVSGDLTNTAVFFSERYFSKTLGLSGLKRLAAHVIWMGHELNQPAVDGLQIMTFRYGDETPVMVGETELTELREFSRMLDVDCRNQFTSST